MPRRLRQLTICQASGFTLPFSDAVVALTALPDPTTTLIPFMIMRQAKVTQGGQISIPATIRRRWGTSRLTLEDLGDRVVLKPAPDDPIAAARGALAGELSLSSERLREQARADEARAEWRRSRGR